MNYSTVAIALAMTGTLSALLAPGCGGKETTSTQASAGTAGASGASGSGGGGASGSNAGGSTAGGSSAGGKGNTGGSGSGGTSGGTANAGAGGFVACPPCVAPPSPDCVGTGPCGCGPYICPDGGVTECTSGDPEGVCAPGQTCECCPIGGPLERCLCTTACETDDDCPDPARPFCFVLGPTGICTPTDFGCCACQCASPDTSIATPTGDRAIAELEVGDLVYSVEGGAIVVAAVRQVNKRPVVNHRVQRVTLETGVVLEISAGHPTADGRSFRDLRAGAELDGVRIVSVRSEPYAYPFTYDILPDSSSGAYFAGGVLIGSTLSGGPASSACSGIAR